MLLDFEFHQDESQRLHLENESMKEKIKENLEKVKLNKQLPYLVGNVVEVRKPFSYHRGWRADYWQQQFIRVTDDSIA